MGILWLLNIMLFTLASALPKRYDDYAIYRLTPHSEEELDYLRSLKKYDDVEFLTPLTKVGYAANVLLPPQYQGMFLEESRSLNNNVTVEVVLQNVQQAIIDEGLRPDSKAGSFDWEYFYTFDDMQLWVNGLASEYPNNIKIINLKTIGPAVATYILNEILHSSDSKIVELRNKFTWYIAPVERFWRKTRTPTPEVSDGKCIGIDPNRNWDFHFDEGYVDVSRCTDVYPGQSAFSETCTRELSNFLLSIPEKIQSYIGLHSFNQSILIPYSNSADHLDNYDQVYKIAKGAANVLKSVNGKDFKVGTAAEVLVMGILWLLNIVLFALASALPKRYDDYAIYCLTPHSEEELDFLKSLKKYEDVEFLTPLTKVGYAVNVLLPPQYQGLFLEKSRSLNHNITVEVVVQNVQQDIIDEGLRPDSKAGSFDWEYYYTFDDMQLWINGLASEYPNNVEVVNLKTYENRNLSVVKVAFNPDATKAIFIEAGIHARECASRKSRWICLLFYVPGGECIGIDPNRNWDFNFRGVPDYDDFSCSEVYPGQYPFSEPCTRELSNFLLKIPEKIQSYISLHSAAEAILIPYSNSSDHFENYDQVVGPCVGASMDWVKEKMKVPFVVTYELRGLRFIIPANQIIPASLETLQSILYALKEAEDL
nr:unnamed protein product [Callosobruchus analis]